MAKFEVNYKHTAEYDSKVELEIRLQTRPTQTDYKKILDAIETLNEVAQKYVKIPVATPQKVNKK